VSHQSVTASAPKPGCTIHLPCPIRPGDDE
jgi:hypothetical protein